VKANVLFFDRKPAREKPWTQKLWIYDLRTNLHFTLKENTLKRTDLDDFVKCYNPKNRHERKEGMRFKSFTYDELTKRDQVIRRHKGSSSIVGVQKLVDWRFWPPRTYWKATWSPEPYVVRRKWFSAKKFGARKARRLAIRARRAGVRSMQ
jgi:hypothetical protein